MTDITRRSFGALLTGAATSAALGGLMPTHASGTKAFKISLAQWSLNKSFWGPEGMSPLYKRRRNGENITTLLRDNLDDFLSGGSDPHDFAVTARRTFGFDAIEYVNTFYFDKANNSKYLHEMKARADGEGVRSLLMMCDREGRLGDPDKAVRTKAVEAHYKWIEMIKFLGGHTIRVNAGSEGTWQEQHDLAVEGLSRLAEYAAKDGINVIVENHGGLSSDGKWLASVMKTANLSNLGTLPDFGNFKISDDNHYDAYQGVDDLMPYAKSVSAKFFDFDDDGNETTLDIDRFMRIVLRHGFKGHVGIEYEGHRLSEHDGIFASKALLERIRDQHS